MLALRVGIEQPRDSGCGCSTAAASGTRPPRHPGAARGQLRDSPGAASSAQMSGVSGGDRTAASAAVVGEQHLVCSHPHRGCEAPEKSPCPSPRPAANSSAMLGTSQECWPGELSCSLRCLRVRFGHPERLRVPRPLCRAGPSPTDLGAGLLLLGGWHLVLGSHHQLGCLLPWEGNSAR